MVSTKAKTYARVLREILEGGGEAEVKEKVRRLKQILQKHGDSKHTSAILREFVQAWETRKGPLATVVTPAPLPSVVRSEMQRILRKSRYVLREKIDHEVIGGVALYLGSEFVIDNTIKGKLKRIAKLLEK